LKVGEGIKNGEKRSYELLLQKGLEGLGGAVFVCERNNNREKVGRKEKTWKGEKARERKKKHTPRRKRNVWEKNTCSERGVDAIQFYRKESQGKRVGRKYEKMWQKGRDAGTPERKEA